jgi:hypothetical protein
MSNLRRPGIVRLIDGSTVDLYDIDAAQVSMENIAWGLGRIPRYNGHITEDYTPAHHSVIMSYLVPEEYALEALLHDATESLMGDIIWPVKSMFPEIEEFENKWTYKIMNKFGVTTHRYTLPVLEGKGRVYKKSDVVSQADRDMLEHESFSLGRPGTYIQEVEDAWLKACELHEQWWYLAPYPFMERYCELAKEKPHYWVNDEDGLDLEYFSALWFKEDVVVEAIEQMGEEQLLEALT